MTEQDERATMKESKLTADEVIEKLRKDGKSFPCYLSRDDNITLQCIAADLIESQQAQIEELSDLLVEVRKNRDFVVRQAADLQRDNESLEAALGRELGANVDLRHQLAESRAREKAAVDIIRSMCECCDYCTHGKVPCDCDCDCVDCEINCKCSTCDSGGNFELRGPKQAGEESR